MNEILLEELKERLNKKNTSRLETDERSVLASVMLLLKPDSERLDMLFIKRPDNPGDRFSGQMAFPGGKMHVDDADLLETAIRETREEVGIDLMKYGTVIGKLDDTRPSTRSADYIIVTPYVSIITHDVNIITNEEVDEYIWIPLYHLMDESNMRVRVKKIDDRYVNDYVFGFGKYIIWGMTGRVLKKFIDEFGNVLNTG